MPLPKQYSVLILSFLLLSWRISAQEGIHPVDSTAPNGISAYRERMGYSSRLYNGSEYIRTYRNAAGTPFLTSDSLQPGMVSYDGITYTNVFLNYDLVHDEVIIKGMQAFALQLVRDKVDSFTLGLRRFLYMGRNNPYALTDGFYEVLHRGKVLVLAKRVKRFITSIRTDEPSRFVFSSLFYVLQKGRVWDIEKGRDLLNPFPDQREAIRKHMQQTGLNYKKDPEGTLVQVVSFYEQTMK